jgi:hypothetical protein
MGRVPRPKPRTFTDEQIRFIRQAYRQGWRLKDIANEMNSYPTLIFQIVNGQTYKYVDG